MALVVGIDGCRAGWLCIALDLSAGRPTPTVVPHDDPNFLGVADVVAIDIPIGLPATAERRCDREARRLLVERRNSVFPCPVRSVLDATSYEAACALSEAACGKRISQQTYGILPKIRHVDKLLRGSTVLAAHVREVHPEVCFARWNNNAPMSYPKKTGFGCAERLRLVESAFGTAAHDVRRTISAKAASDDDILDAFAALWTAERLYNGVAVPVTAMTETDDFGLPMQMWA